MSPTDAPAPAATAADREVLERERRIGRVVGPAGLASVVAMVAAVMLASAATTGSAKPVGPGFSDEPIDRARHLADFHENVAEHTGAVLSRSIGLALVAVVGLFLWTLVRRRDPRAARPAVAWLSLVGPGLLIGATLFGFVALQGVADDFMAGGARTTARARELIDDSGALRAASVADGATRIVFAIWLALLAAGAMRVGLLTRFLGYWGVAAAGSMVLLPIGDAMLAGWVGSVAVLALGYWPGGRPPAWSSTTPQPTEAI
ncbi:DUF4386 family protein [Patulibacter defluvii]|uniref:DUF4386 family protein n=1 Tax=Patulibacter defluvii TaxID=3095358 RepID=UPI002A75FDB3|nr:DUF4386 family protein [Patulibacter sp. DM4]